jgi:hypothetical protein
MGYPSNFSSAAFDRAFATTDKWPAPTSQEVMAVLAENNTELTRTVVAAIEQILFAKYGRSARMDASTQASVADEIDAVVADTVSFLNEGRAFSQYISEIEGWPRLASRHFWTRRNLGTLETLASRGVGQRSGAWDRAVSVARFMVK